MQKSLAVEPPRLWMDCLTVCPWRVNVSELSSCSKIVKNPNIMVKTNCGEKTPYELDVLRPASSQNPPRPHITYLAHALIQVFTLSIQTSPNLTLKGRYVSWRGKNEWCFNFDESEHTYSIYYKCRQNIVDIEYMVWSHTSIRQAIASVNMKNGISENPWKLPICHIWKIFFCCLFV